MTGTLLPPVAGSAATFAARVRRGEEVLGTFVKLSGLEPVDLVELAGFDFVVFDAEHSQLAPAEVARQVRHAVATGLPAMVRVPSVDAGLVNRLLEAGAAGIQVSSITTARQGRELRAAMHYPPEGTRSVSGAQPAARYGGVALTDYLAAVAADPPLVVGQIETSSTDDPLDEVLVPLDVAFVGTTDLSVDIGVAGKLTHPAVLGRIDEIAAAARRRAVLGGWVAGPADVPVLRRRGATYLVVGSDLQALRQGLSTMVAPAGGLGRVTP